MHSEARGPKVGGGAFNNYGGQAYMDYLDNPQNYTKSRPNEAAAAAFTTSQKRNEYVNYYKVPEPPTPAAPTPEPKAEPYKAPEQVGISDKLANANQYLQDYTKQGDYTKSGKNFQSSTLSDRQAKTDSFSQKPAYDPNAGVSSAEAGNFLNDYKLDLQKTIKNSR